MTNQTVKKAKKEEAVLREAAKKIVTLKLCIEAGGDQTAQNMWRGCIEGLLTAAKIMTNQYYSWDSDGIYENGSNEPIIKA